MRDRSTTLPSQPPRRSGRYWQRTTTSAARRTACRGETVTIQSPPRCEMIEIVIADDELAARRRLKRLLAGNSNVSIVGEFSDGSSAIEGIRRLRPDVALLDIQMPERDGLEVAAAVNVPDEIGRAHV